MKKRINNLPVRPKSTKLMKMLPRIKTTVKNGGKTKSSSGKIKKGQKSTTSTTGTTTTLPWPYVPYKKTWFDSFIDWIFKRK